VGARRGQRRFYTLTAIRQIGLTDQHADARRVLNWIRTKGQHEVSREELRREALGRRLDATQTQKLIDRLCQAGWLREKIIPTAGRHARRWEVNAKLFA
jgi:hypothetical protein